MSNKFKIAIAGIGGVGGFYGAKLAGFYDQHKDVEINFVARGNHLNKIKTEGIKLITDTETIISHPHKITSWPEELGMLDLIIFCCKAYDLQDLAKQFSGNISEKTFLLPLLNGVDHTETLQKLFPNAKVLYGCVYIFSNIQSDGVIKVNGSLNNLLFGNPAFNLSDLKRIEKIFTNAGINCRAHDDIKLKTWEKFTFISPLASITSAYNIPVGQILEDKKYKNLLITLMHEVADVAKAEEIDIPATVIESNIEKLKKLPYTATSSMQIDFINNKNTELETLTGSVIKKASKAKINIPAYQKIYQQLIKMQ